MRLCESMRKVQRSDDAEYYSPVFHAITESQETDTSIVGEVLHELVLVEPPLVGIVKALREIPVVEGLRIKSR